MKWIAKAAVQRTLSAFPRGDEVNYFMQRRVTKALPRTDEDFRLHGRYALAHFHAFRRHLGDIDPGRACFYEFGAGWDLIVPLIYHGLGVGRQVLVDIRANVRFQEVDHAIAQYGRFREELERSAGRPLKGLEPASVRSTEELRDRFGITYLAPRDARDTKLPEGSVDFVSSTFTLEHIPRADIAAILGECLRLLRPGGMISCAVDLQDHYSFFDPSISPYNFLKFSEPTWRLINSSLHYQNRLRGADYRELFEDTGFEVVEETPDGPSEPDLETIRALGLSRRFRGYSPEALGIRAITLVAVKPA